MAVNSLKFCATLGGMNIGVLGPKLVSDLLRSPRFKQVKGHCLRVLDKNRKKNKKTKKPSRCHQLCVFAKSLIFPNP